MVSLALKTMVKLRDLAVGAARVSCYTSATLVFRFLVCFLPPWILLLSVVLYPKIFSMLCEAHVSSFKISASVSIPQNTTPTAADSTSPSHSTAAYLPSLLQLLNGSSGSVLIPHWSLSSLVGQGPSVLDSRTV